MFILFFLDSTFLISFAASKAAQVREGNELYHSQEYRKAIDRYRAAWQKDQESDIINYDLGTAHYKSGNHPEAIDHLEKSLLSEDPTLRQHTHYNLGNAFYKLGKEFRQREPQTTMVSWEKSLKHYEQALELDTQDRLAHENYEFVKKELEKLKQQQRNQQNQQPQSSQQQQKSQQQQQKQGQDSKSQDQNQGDRDREEHDSEKDRDQQSSQEDAEAQKDRPEHQGEQSLPGSLKGQMSRREAERALEQYQNDEQPQGLWNMMKGRRRAESPVLKDW